MKFTLSAIIVAILIVTLLIVAIDFYIENVNI